MRPRLTLLFSFFLAAALAASVAGGWVAPAPLVAGAKNFLLIAVEAVGSIDTAQALAVLMVAYALMHALRALREAAHDIHGIRRRTAPALKKALLVAGCVAACALTALPPALYYGHHALA